MTGAGDEGPDKLRVDRWLPPEPTSAAARPAVRVGGWIPPTSPPALGEQPAHRRGPTGVPRTYRRRTLILATVAAAASVPLVVGLASVPSGLAPPSDARPALLPTRDTLPPEVLTPSTAGATAAPARPSATAPTTTSSAGAQPTVPPIRRPVPGQPATSSAGPEAVAISVEAEGPMAVRSGQTTVRELPAESGGKVVTGIGGSPANTVRFLRVNVPQAGTYTLTLHYVATQPRLGTVTVDGRPLTVGFSATADEWGTIGAVSVRVPLDAGPNSVEFGNRRAPAPDLDRIVLTD